MVGIYQGNLTIAAETISYQGFSPQDFMYKAWKIAIFMSKMIWFLGIIGISKIVIQWLF